MSEPITLGENNIEFFDDDDVNVRRAECQQALMGIIEAAREYGEVPLCSVYLVIVPEEGRARGLMTGLTDPLLHVLRLSLEALLDGEASS
jgi:hypothetical protein